MKTSTQLNKYFINFFGLNWHNKNENLLSIYAIEHINLKSKSQFIYVFIHLFIYLFIHLFSYLFSFLFSVGEAWLNSGNLFFSIYLFKVIHLFFYLFLL